MKCQSCGYSKSEEVEVERFGMKLKANWCKRCRRKKLGRRDK